MTDIANHHAEYVCPECGERAYFDRPPGFVERWSIHLYHDHDDNAWRFALRKDGTRHSEGFKALTEGKRQQKKRLVEKKRAKKVDVDPDTYKGWWDV